MLQNCNKLALECNPPCKALSVDPQFALLVLSGFKIVVLSMQFYITTVSKKVKMEQLLLLSAILARILEFNGLSESQWRLGQLADGTDIEMAGKVGQKSSYA